jgi:hypothetical protein
MDSQRAIWSVEAHWVVGKKTAGLDAKKQLVAAGGALASGFPSSNSKSVPHLTACPLYTVHHVRLQASTF